MLISVCKKVLKVTYHLLAKCCLVLSAAVFLCKKEVFPTVESHYTRKRSKRQYLNGDLSITKM